MGSVEINLRSLPYLDVKWLRADLISALRSSEDLALLWNNLIQDNEFSNTSINGIVNSSGQISYLNDDGKHYFCGVQKLTCSCCTGYCSPNSNCNCLSCQKLDAEEPAVKKGQNYEKQQSSTTPSEQILESWLWGPTPSKFFDYFFFFNLKKNT